MADDKEKKPKSVKVSDVLAKDKSPKSESKASTGKKKKMKHTHIEHHDDGSHTIRHTPMGGGDEVSYSKPDLDGVHDGLEEHVGDVNAGEEQPEMVGNESQPLPQPQPQAV